MGISRGDITRIQFASSPRAGRGNGCASDPVCAIAAGSSDADVGTGRDERSARLDEVQHRGDHGRAHKGTGSGVKAGQREAMPAEIDRYTVIGSALRIAGGIINDGPGEYQKHNVGWRIRGCPGDRKVRRKCRMRGSADGE